MLGIPEGDVPAASGTASAVHGSPLGSIAHGERRRPPTIADVARVAGVSQPTVSRVLTGNIPVREVTKDRVRAAMKSLGYRPNGAARALVQGRQPIVGVITRDTSLHGYSRMLANIESRARQAGYLVAIVALDPADLQTSMSALDVLLGQPIIGVVVLDYTTYDVRLKDSLGNLPISTVIHGDLTDIDVPHVRVDDRKAAYEVTNHLLSLGHRTVHHVAAPSRNGEPHIREAAWRQALLDAGAPVPEALRTDWSIAAAREAGTALARDPGVTAIFCANDEIAFAVMRSIHEAGKRVPQDISVAGIDDEPLAATWVPGLTTYRLDFDWAGAAALELLMEPDEPVSTAGTPSYGLVTRESTAPPPATE
ncbi:MULTISPECIES: LacI family DNA-binding transcriptional regulator [Arthrobacter]|uniref:LacI family transcriptional regulator n=1 Tax=Arthrobacter terricola TaxID=2547396 RepID=A0A4R5KFZ3_9MICC|nr:MULTISPECIES: LacI family DNA-binding transcriptional regulator [Arthrobacter]MBT8159659.1 LacI family transcriptional regulator [Arthrobacter sp. GN70]TDF93615.1 LacI family transcriptional regulator [Arthrobacter terricola]